jgi:glutamate-1-semialdehyde aminotransferase
MDNTSQSEEERAASLQLTLRDVLTQQGHLLQVASTTASLRYQFLEAVVYILEATAAFLQQWERIQHALLRKKVVCQAFSLLLAYLGPGDAQVRGARGCAANLKGC